MSAIITLEQAFEKLQQPNVVFIDTQFIFGKSAEGRSYYEEQHIPGAVYFHLDEDLSGPILTHGGRHPIPQQQVFEEKLRAAGISNDSEVIVYDNTGGATAARMWWLLNYFGHTNTLVLEQPIAKWQQAGYPVTNEESTPKRGTFTANVQPNLEVDIENVKAHLSDDKRILIDARVEDVYSGGRATKYKKIGHIPGARNLFWERLLDDELRINQFQLAQQVVATEDLQQEIVVYCGAGVTACANILVLSQLGYENVKLYVGSWGDWASYDDTPAQVSNKE